MLGRCARRAARSIGMRCEGAGSVSKGGLLGWLRGLRPYNTVLLWIRKFFFGVFVFTGSTEADYGFLMGRFVVQFARCWRSEADGFESRSKGRRHPHHGRNATVCRMRSPSAICRTRAASLSSRATLTLQSRRLSRTS